jgi:hypothetical protein
MSGECEAVDGPVGVVLDELARIGTVVALGRRFLGVDFGGSAPESSAVTRTSSGINVFDVSVGAGNLQLGESPWCVAVVAGDPSCTRDLAKYAATCKSTGSDGFFR